MVHHVTLPDLQVSYAGKPSLESLAITWFGSGRAPVMFLWRHDQPARVEQVLADPSHGLETLRPVPSGEFPTDRVVDLISVHSERFPDSGANLIVGVLRNACT